MKSEGLDTSRIVSCPDQSTIDDRSLENRTAQYVAINDARKDLVLAMADMSIFASEKAAFPNSSFWTPPPKWAVVDANWHPNTIRRFLHSAKKAGSKTAFEPVSVPKSASIFTAPTSVDKTQLRIFPEHLIDVATPNQHELAAIHAAAKDSEYFETDKWWQIIDALGIPSSGARDRFVRMTNEKMTDEGIPLQTIQLLPYIPTILTKLGSGGVLLTELLRPGDPRLTDPSSAPYILSRCSNGSTEVGGVYLRLFPAVEVVENVASVNGVGDTFLGVLVAGLARGLALDEKLIDIAQRGAVMTLKSKEAVSPKLGDLIGQMDGVERM